MSLKKYRVHFELDKNYVYVLADSHERAEEIARDYLQESFPISDVDAYLQMDLDFETDEPAINS